MGLAILTGSSIGPRAPRFVVLAKKSISCNAAAPTNNSADDSDKPTRALGRFWSAVAIAPADATPTAVQSPCDWEGPAVRQTCGRPQGGEPGNSAHCRSRGG